MMWMAHADGRHVTPVDDLREHDAAAQCWCHPIEDDECPGLFVHNSMDGREQFETGKRQVS
jgi:hypothetical protein